MRRATLILSLLAATLVAACAPSEQNPRASKKSDPDEGDAKARDENAGSDDGDSDSKDAKKKQKPSRNGGDQDGDGDSDDEDDDGEAAVLDRKKISFKGARGDDVPGYLWEPAAGGKHPAVLLMYGISDDKDSGTIGEVGVKLAKAGFVAMTIDWPGTGDRQPAISKQDRIVKADVKEWTVDDYGKAVDFLKSQSSVDGTKLGYVGASMGAMTGLVFASRDARIKATVAIVPIPNPLWGKDNPSSALGRLDSRPVLCISTADNSDFSGEVCKNVKAGHEAKTLAGGHELEGMHDEVAKLAVDFLTKSLD